jgi:hypothetical protein
MMKPRLFSEISRQHYWGVLARNPNAKTFNFLRLKQGQYKKFVAVGKHRHNRLLGKIPS